MTSFPRYDRYKDSGVDWLGEIPEHWDTSRSKWLFSQRKERCRRDDEQLTASQKYGVIPQSKFMELEGRRVVMVMLNPEILKRAKKGDFVISMRTFQGGIEMSEYDGAVSSAYVPLAPGDKIHSGYFKYLFKTERYIKALGNTSNLIRDGQALRFDNFSMVDLPVIPIEDQKRIASFLDRKTAEIDALIAKKQRQIELLDEQKAILINRAVTRGLNPNAKLKPSGIEWIGDIPVHWEVKSGLAYFQETDVRSTTGDEELLSVSHITGVTPRSEKNITMFMAESYEGSKICEIGDIAVNTMWAWMAALGVSKYRGLISPSYNTYCQKKPERYHPNFLDLLLRSNPYKGHYFVNSSGITTSRLRLYPHPFLRLKFLRPPLEEQEQIVEHCSQVSGLVKKSADAVTEQIDSLKAFRSTLIAHAVTGRIKVA